MNSERLLIELSLRNHRLVGPAELRRAGISAARWRRWQDQDRWLQVTPVHFRHAATPLTFEMSVHAGSQWLGTRGALFASGSLTWLGVEVKPPQIAEFLVPRSVRWVPHWMTIHTTRSWSDSDVIRSRGVRVTTATRALLDYASTAVRAADLESAIDSAIRLRRTALPRLTARLAAVGGRGRAGTAMMRELLLDSGGESLLERRFLRLLRAHGYPRPHCQVVFRREGGSVMRVDFRFPATNVVVEVSGRLGHTTDRERQKDARRRNALQQSGLVVLEFTTADVIDASHYVLSTLRDSVSVPR